MKPHFYKVPVSLQDSFRISHDVKANFGTIWHYHPELELHYVVRGEGVRFIGDNVSNFSAGEILLVGENLPHTWRCNQEYFQEGSGLQVEAILIQFRTDCFGRDFLNLDELHAIRVLFERARQGLLFHGATNQKLAGLMRAAITATPFQRLMTLLSILDVIAQSDEMEIITSAKAFYQSNEMETVRLNNICNYTLANYAQPITLEEIASVANLSVTSFCRYFKLMTHKTYHDFLNEVRISHACRSLVENKMSTEEICFESGFNNLSNFYRNFKRIKGLTPGDYKNRFVV
ncbi:AraC family transcriptional regulator [Siphonobacter aquaeclarae]|uniref:AraC-type DNA-binding protein n=1 Tax=Siphonobacter aquaeclarae TaxID=563176 RepID=A0A1G9JQC3_9BACT|nr:AraC family transcriptional regulator [Siphonobacter aquaeclarae]SDL39739.1 AraC-type DNA-binding protein [Siphonobacter aquaeclarae]